VHRKAYLVICDLVPNLFALAARVDQSAFAQNAQVVRHSGTRNAKLFGKSDSAFLAVAEKPEYFDPRAVAEHFEKLGGGFKIFVINVRMMRHFPLLFGNNIRPFGRKSEKTVDFLCCKQYNTFRTIKQVFNCKKTTNCKTAFYN
jgi:hypothetical protein